MRNVEVFLHTYNEFDKQIKKILGVDGYMSHTKVLDRLAKKNKLINRNIDELKAYARLRNCIVHDTTSSGFGKPIAEPLPEIVENYKRILNLLINPLTVYDICTYRSKMLIASPNQLAMDVMHAMKQQLVSRVPIVEDDKVVGVFNGNTLIYYMLSTYNPIITDKSTINDFMKYASLDTQRKEHFEFVTKKISIYEAENLFKYKNKDNHRLIALFITSDGTQKGKLLGIVTEWDINNKIK
ncbi:CBS domain-containing protein [Paramaledivibacter caminithermalis]|jgi:CBS domain-containing protein|uniref:CBS domain-containing protein n=1 Tax=Paramaledivibacter caminithermalis (strain DSM 15212 / CIP 107654 / DViRD3) TaxID=1121301 RepID=A0A1M6T5Q2_PARC5|nr:CBS domain-containing protein [Paramaledivibacter caminithermalis]SHK52284.1 CBS domain-containing protein [Paramaledivibacter caminithermalis DSM 15212]